MSGDHNQHQKGRRWKIRKSGDDLLVCFDYTGTPEDKHIRFVRAEQQSDFECPRCGHCCQAKGEEHMSREAIEEAIEVLEDASADMLMETGDENYYSEAIAVLRQALDVNGPEYERGFVDGMQRQMQSSVDKALNEKQEPAAWRTFDGEGGYDYRSYEMNETYDKEWAERNPNHKGWVEPLYTAPPKREWIGLTSNEARKFYEKYTDREELIHAIDKFLEEKNT